MVAVESGYKEGALHGKMSEYGPRGKKRTEIAYKDNLKHGDMLVYGKNGKVVQHSVYKEGRLVRNETTMTRYKYKK